MESLSTANLQKLNLKRIYQGTFNYFHNETNYCEESFEVLKDKEKSTLQFNSEMLSRTLKGELFQANVNFSFNQNFIPTYVQISKQLGNESSKEVYRFNESSSSVEYRFVNRGVSEKSEIKVTSKFHIAAPTISQSMVYILTKNFDIANKQSCKLIRNDNKWVYKKGPYDQNMIVEKSSTKAKPIVIGGHKLKATLYHIYEETEDLLNNVNAKRPDNHLMVYVSKYHSLPYMIEDKVNNHRIEISQLKNLVADEA